MSVFCLVFIPDLSWGASDHKLNSTSFISTRYSHFCTITKVLCVNVTSGKNLFKVSIYVYKLIYKLSKIVFLYGENI